MRDKKIQEQITPYDELKALVKSDLEKVDALILSYVKSEVELIPTISKHLTAAGGKRLRPILTLACSRLFSHQSESCIKLATAVEFIHTATLLHDDVIDESHKRRNLPTANNIWGNKASILVGDYLLSQSFRLMVSTGNIDALDMLANAALIITESEVWQLELINDIKLSMEAYIKLVTGKTGVLFAAACAVAAVAHQPSKESINQLYNFGLNLGICFQIMDDILDYYPSDEKFGKAVGNDFYEGKITLPFLIAYNKADSKDKKALAELMQSHDKTAEMLERILEYFAAYDTLEECLDVATSFSEKGERYIASWQESDVGRKMKDAIRYSAHRKF